MRAVNKNYGIYEYTKTAESVQRLIRAYRGENTDLNSATAKGALIGAALASPIAAPLAGFYGLAGGLGDHLLVSGAIAVPLIGGAILGGAISRKFKRNQNRMLAIAKYHPELIRSGKIKRPLDPGIVSIYGPHAYGLYNKTRQIYDYTYNH